MKDNLPSSKTIKKYESGIINLDDSKGNGTHWIAYKKQNNNIFYYDSFGLDKIPKLVLKYFEKNKKNKIYSYNNQDQQFNEVICGHLCLKFLINF